VAEALRDWLPIVIQVLDPWMSAKDMDKGARWRTVISTQLEESDFGIVCLTRDSMESPWLLFESGALSKFQHGSRVCTFLLDIEPSEVREPLAQFHHTSATREDVFKLVETINKELGNASLQPRTLEKAFDLA
jgi:hypothetical protein